MTQRITTQLPDRLLSLLHEGCSALLLTVDSDGFPHSAYTWAVAPSSATVRFGLEYNTMTMQHLQREPKAALHLIAQEDRLYLIKGTTRTLKSQIEAAPFEIALLALDITQVKDQRWPGVMVQPLTYQWPPDRRKAMLAMERAVYAEMRDWQPETGSDG